MTFPPDLTSQPYTAVEASSEPDRGGLDLVAYAGELRRAVRRLDASGPDSWRAVVDRGLAEAYKRRDPVGLASMIELIVGFLDAEGRVAEAVSEIEHAIARSKGDPAILAILEALRASFLSGSGDVDAAMKAITASELAQAQTTLPLALGRGSRLCAGVRMATLTVEDVGPIEELMALGASEQFESAILHLLSVYIPYRFALGEHVEARPWARGLRMAAEATHHTFRLSDAETFDRADATISSFKAPSAEGLPIWNWVAPWRIHALRLYVVLVRREAGPAQKELAALLRARRRAGGANLDGIDAFQTNVQAAISTPDQAVMVPRPASVHLLNLGSTLAGAEAVAIAGNQSEASAWYDWLTTNLPARVQTSIEWPVSRLRVQGLLALRAGDFRKARRGLEAAVEWAARANYPVELAIAQVQLSEFLDLYGGPTPKTLKMISELREEGWTRLRSLGIDPAPHAYVVAHRAAAARNRLPVSPLTRRETDTLVLLADGLSYKEIGQRLGIAWPTVQAFAHRCYEKLNVSGKSAAIQAARELGIL